MERNEHVNMAICDTDGTSYLTGGTILDNSDREYFIKALSGENAVSDPYISKLNNSLIFSFAVPIKEGNKVIGVLVATHDGNVLSNYISNMTYGENGTVFIINKEGRTIAHQNKDLVLNLNNEQENVNTNLDLQEFAEVQKHMMEGKESVEKYILGSVENHVAYVQVDGTNWALGLTVPDTQLYENVQNLGRIISSISIIFVICSLIITVIIANAIATPIKKAANYLNVIAAGDFTGNISANLLDRHDETGILAKSIITMQESIKKVIVDVSTESTTVSDMLEVINSSIDKLNRSIDEVSATTEELSAGTEETAASTEEMSATSIEIEQAISTIASKAQEGANTASDLSILSETMKKNAIDSKVEATAIYGKNREHLQKAIDQASEVNQISELSNAILDITAQTNLLALNASIEAARAGEAGKGFAVVANEIGQLAENSRKSVAKIQEVAAVILEAVNNLSISSKEIMEFIDKKVLKDYDGLVESSEEYSTSSYRINDIVNDFSNTSKELLVSMKNMAETIEQIAETANEEAQGASNIAGEVLSITHMAEDMIKLSMSAKEKSNLLVETVSQFKI